MRTLGLHLRRCEKPGACRSLRSQQSGSSSPVQTLAKPMLGARSDNKQLRICCISIWFTVQSLAPPKNGTGRNPNGRTLMPRIAAVPLLRCVALLRSVRSARRLVAQNRVYINGQRAQDEHAMVGNADTATWLRFGRYFWTLFRHIVNRCK
jgi:hypothetical protein